MNHFKALSIVFILFILPYIIPTGETNAQVPLPPVLSQPLNNAENVSLTPNLQWSFVLPLGEILSYRLQLSETNNFSALVIDDQNVNADHFNIPEGTLQEKTQYFWRVNATVKIGLVTMTTSYSSVFSFTTLGLTGVTQLSNNIPGKFKLYPNYPNPFNPSTNIRFDIIGQSEADLKIYSSSGEEISGESLGTLSPGSYEYNWNASGLPSGAYFYRLTARLVESLASEFVSTKKMILIK